MIDYAQQTATEPTESEESTDRDRLADLKSLCQTEFDDDTAAMALALGRETIQIEDMMAGNTPVDEDLEMKINGIAQERSAAETPSEPTRLS